MVISVLMLCVEVLLDLIGVITGIIVLTRSSDNKLQRTWGILAITLSSLLLYDNIEWLYLFSQGVSPIAPFMELPMDHLSIWHIFRVIVFFQFYSILPIASLRPGWLGFSRIVAFSVPGMLIVCVICCYEAFNGNYTSLDSFKDILKSMGNQDVALRMVLFVLSVIAPTYNFIFPFLNKWLPFRRKHGPAMLFYMISFILIMCAYIWLMLGTSGLSFNVFGYVVIIPVIYLNILYLRDENPLTLPLSSVEKMETEEMEALQEVEVSPAVLEVCERLRKLMDEKRPFTDSAYTLPNLLEELDTNVNRLNKALRYEGFSGFRDYISFCRLQYFKELAVHNKTATVKELMFSCGFTSRSSFYRLFANLEKMSPSQYMEKLNEDVT